MYQLNNYKRTLNITVYTPESSIRHPVRMVYEMFQDLFAGRELAWRLAVRDISAHYRQTALGLLWAFILPLANTVVWMFLSSSGIVTIRDTSLPYPIYVFSGTMIWAIFMDAVNAPLQQTINAKQMLAKINFPRESLVMSGVYQALFNGAIKVALLLSVLLVSLLSTFKFAQGWTFNPGWSLILFPFGILSLVLTGTAIGLLLTPIGVLYTDIGKSLPLLMQFLMYLSPVVYDIPTVPWAAAVFKLNPITPLIMTTRDWLTGISPEHTDYFLIVNVFILAILLVVWVIYRAAMPILIERMSA